MELYSILLKLKWKINKISNFCHHAKMVPDEPKTCSYSANSIGLGNSYLKPNYIDK
jgi:hypothetical protein